MIRPIPSGNQNKSYEDEDVNKLVDLSLRNLNNKNIINNIFALISSRDLKTIKLLIAEMKSKYTNQEDIIIYTEIEQLFERIYSNTNCDNLRGTFLELIIYKFLNSKYSDAECYKSAYDCYVDVLGDISKRTVDVFAICGRKGFICECKIGHNYFEAHDIANLNEIYFMSFEILKPYIITLAPQMYINEKLKEILYEDDTNILVHMAIIKVFSIENIYDLFS